MNGSDCVIHIFGITKDSSTNNFMMVMEYAKEGNLRQKLNRDFNTMTWYNKIRILRDIAWGIMNLHKKELTHQDFHSGNILFSDDNYSCISITDLGLCKPANEKSEKHNK